MTRRGFIQLLTMMPAILAAFPLRVLAEEKLQPVKKTKSEWKKLLTFEQYDVLREEGTEPAYTSPLVDEHRDGVFQCAGCGLPLFPSAYKYDSGTGWPSFYDVMHEHIETKVDYRLVVARIEYHCARCGGHQGHVFNDGPEPTGMRYCNNGVALKFTPESEPVGL